jgi:hypothetical protein
MARWDAGHFAGRDVFPLTKVCGMNQLTQVRWKEVEVQCLDGSPMQAFAVENPYKSNRRYFRMVDFKPHIVNALGLAFSIRL